MSRAALSEALQLLLREIPERFPAETIDTIWIFAPREIGRKEVGLVLLSLRDPAPGEEARRVVTWRYEAVRERGRLRRTDLVVEQGRAPTERIPRLIEGVLARLGDPSENPRVEAIGGDPERWSGFLASCGIAPVDPPYEE